MVHFNIQGVYFIQFHETVDLFIIIERCESDFINIKNKTDEKVNYPNCQD